MFKFFKKKNVEKVETIFPTAKYMLETTSTRWYKVSAEEILERINKEARNGERHVCFFRSVIRKKTYKELRQQGYQVDVSTHHDAPCFKVSW